MFKLKLFKIHLKLPRQLNLNFKRRRGIGFGFPGGDANFDSDGYKWVVFIKIGGADFDREIHFAFVVFCFFKVVNRNAQVRHCDFTKLYRV